MTRKIIISFIVALVLFFVLAAIIYLILKSKSEEGAPLGAPTAEEKTMEERIAGITAPERAEPLTQAEKQRIEKLLLSVTAP